MNQCVEVAAGTERYRQRFARVLAHIESHADTGLSLDALSAIAAFSRHHFHRQFSGQLGMSVHRYVQFMRMRRASWRLAFRAQMSVNEIALATGYEGPEAFARAFRQCSGQSPSGFRAQPDWAGWHARFRPFIHLRQSSMDSPTSAGEVRIVNFPATRVALLEHRGSPVLIGDSIRRFIEWRKSQGLSPRVSATFNILHNDPDEARPGEYRCGLCVATERPIPQNAAGIVAAIIPGGRCALLRHVGSDDHLNRSIMQLYANWLPASGEEPRDFPLFVQRVRFFPDVPDSDAVTDIYLPLASRESDVSR